MPKRDRPSTPSGPDHLESCPDRPSTPTGPDHLERCLGKLQTIRQQLDSISEQLIAPACLEDYHKVRFQVLIDQVDVYLKQPGNENILDEPSKIRSLKKTLAFCYFPNVYETPTYGREYARYTTNFIDLILDYFKTRSELIKEAYGLVYDLLYNLSRASISGNEEKLTIPHEVRDLQFPFTEMQIKNLQYVALRHPTSSGWPEKARLQTKEQAELIIGNSRPVNTTVEATFDPENQSYTLHPGSESTRTVNLDFFFGQAERSYNLEQFVNIQSKRTHPGLCPKTRWLFQTVEKDRLNINIDPAATQASKRQRTQSPTC